MKKAYLQECPPVLREYLGYTETIKGRSGNTVDEYFIDLRTFFRYIKQIRGLCPAAAGPDENISILDVDMALIRSVTLNDVYEFMNYLKTERHNTSKTRARKTTSLRMFFRYLTDYKHVLDVNPVQNLDTPKQKRVCRSISPWIRAWRFCSRLTANLPSGIIACWFFFSIAGSAGRSWPGSICGISGLIIR